MRKKVIFGIDYTDNEYMKLFLYLMVGGTAALLEWGLFYMFLEGLLHIKAFQALTSAVLAATTMAFTVSTLYHYVLGNIFVFDSGSRYKRSAELSLVFLVSIIGLGLNLMLMFLFTSPALLAWQPMPSKILASCIVVVWNYLSRKKWIFK